MDNIKKNLNLFIDTLEKDFVVFLNIEQLNKRFLKDRINTLKDLMPLSMYDFIIYEGNDGLIIKYYHELQRIIVSIKTSTVDGYKIHSTNLLGLNKLFKLAEEININFRNENKND